VTPELAAEGLARDVVRAVQQARRSAGLDVTDRIALRLAGDETVREALQQHRDLLAKEVLAASLELGPLDGEAGTTTVGDGRAVAVSLSRA
jgi:isoleucyl-tRNA synthetase